MTKRLDALEECLAKVEAGTVDHGSFMQEWRGSPSYSAGCGVNAHKAYDGSLDAAKALHEAVLPAYSLQLTHHDCEVFQNPRFSHCGEEIDNPARAWLIAILKALIWEATQ